VLFDAWQLCLSSLSGHRRLPHCAFTSLPRPPNLSVGSVDHPRESIHSFTSPDKSSINFGKMSSMNELFRLLNIRNPFDQDRCIGITLRKANCRNFVAIASRQAAVDKLQKVVKMLDRGHVNEARLEAKLLDISHLLHCKRNHQDQAPAVADDWYDVLSDYHTDHQHSRSGRRAGQEQQRPLPARSTGTHTSQTSPSTEQTILELHRMLLEVKIELNTMRQRERDRSLERSNARLDHEDVRFVERSSRNPTPSSSSTRSSTTSSASSHGPRSVRSSAPEPTFRATSPLPLTERGRATRPRAEESRGPTVTNARMQSPTSHVPLARELQNTDDVPKNSLHGSARTITAASSNEMPTSVAESNSESSTDDEPECGICLSTIPSTGTDTWRCTTCRNATHSECFDAWIARSPEESGIRCVYCRADVHIDA
jgi:hypothetical protein